MQREATSAITDPLALGVDVARYGSAESVLWFRKGRDASSIPCQFFRGVNTVELAQRINEAHYSFPYRRDLHRWGRRRWRRSGQCEGVASVLP